MLQNDYGGPNELEKILALRPKGIRKIWEKLPGRSVLKDKLSGALWGRMIGCILGAPVELKSISEMQDWCRRIGKNFPPTDFWEDVQEPQKKNFYGAYRYEYIKDNMHFVPVDDDIIYTQLALLIMEENGTDFSVGDVGKAWLKYLPFACTAEEVALNNLKKGISPEKTAEIDNPYTDLIGAAIRSDGFAYAAPGWPEKASCMAYNDAFLSHRGDGIYAEMFLAAAQSAAFAVGDPIDALYIGLTEIPENCRLYKDIEWALDLAKNVKDCNDARSLVDERFYGKDPVYANSNLCLIVFGIFLSGGDIVKGLSQIVAMGMDNDCTAASAGSILGAVLGKKNIPEYLYKRFNDTVDTYLISVPKFNVDDMAERFLKLAEKIYND